MYEHKRQKLASVRTYYKRILKNLVLASLIMIFCLMIGVLGYHYSADVEWLDSLHTAAMILSGMGPMVEIKTVAGKWFSTFYALFSGVIFMTNIGIILTPAIHRFFHRLHLEYQ